MKVLNVAAFGALISKITARVNYLTSCNISFSSDDAADIAALVLEAVNIPETDYNKANPEVIAEMCIAIKNSRLVDAIKAYRMLTGLCLRESKEAVESFMVK